MDDFIANVYDYPVYGSGRKKLTAKEKAFNKLKNKLLARHKGKYRKRHNNRALKRLFDSDKLVDLMKCKTVAAYKKAYAAYKKAKTELVKKAEEGGCLRIVDRNDMVDIMPEGGIFVGGGIVGGCGELLLEMEPSAGALVGGINVGGIRVGGRKKKKSLWDKFRAEQSRCPDYAALRKDAKKMGLWGKPSKPGAKTKGLSTIKKIQAAAKKAGPDVPFEMTLKDGTVATYALTNGRVRRLE